MASRVELSNAIKPFTTLEGFVSPGGGETGNGILFTAEWLLCLDYNGCLWGQDFDAFLDLIRRVSPRKGLLARSLGNPTDQEGLDDYTGACAMSVTVAQDVLKYGQSHFWYMNNSGKLFNGKALFIRFQSLIAHIKFAAQVCPNFIERAAWLWSVNQCCKKGQETQDDWILTFFNCYAAKPRTVLTADEFRAILAFDHALADVWGPEGMRAVFERYFGFKHPIALYFPRFVKDTK